MTIEIIEAEFIEQEEVNFWSCWVEISRATEVYLLPATAPGTLDEVELLSYFLRDEDQLFGVAQSKNIEPNEIYNRLTRRILKSFALVVLDEINLLRSIAGLSPRTAAQLRTAVKAKIRS